MDFSDLHGCLMLKIILWKGFTKMVKGGTDLEAVYQWVQQIAVFAVIAFLVLYLMGSQEKKLTLRFYLSLLMLLLILKPAAAFLKLDRVLAEKLTGLETDMEITAINDQIQAVGKAQNQEILEYASRKALSWIDGLVQDRNLDFLDGEVVFDEQILEQTGEVAISGIRITVSRAGKTFSEMQSVLDELEEEMADTLALKKEDVKVNWK